MKLQLLESIDCLLWINMKLSKQYLATGQYTNTKRNSYEKKKRDIHFLRREKFLSNHKNSGKL